MSKIKETKGQLSGGGLQLSLHTPHSLPYILWTIASPCGGCCGKNNKRSYHCMLQGSAPWRRCPPAPATRWASVAIQFPSSSSAATPVTAETNSTFRCSLAPICLFACTCVPLLPDGGRCAPFCCDQAPFTASSTSLFLWNVSSSTGMGYSLFHPENPSFLVPGSSPVSIPSRPSVLDLV